MNVLSAVEMQACDRATAEHYGTPTLELMRTAARALVRFTLDHFASAHRITVLCGRGNNGGDGLMAARLLAEQGREVSTLLLGPAGQFSDDAAVAWAELLACSHRGPVHVIEAEADLEKFAPLFKTDLLVDAIVGTGFQPPLRPLPLAALKLAAKAKKILAVDLPSGWVSDSTLPDPCNEAFPADAVLTFTAPKPAHVFGQLTRSWRDPVAVAPIGSPAEAIYSRGQLQWAGSALRLAAQPRSIAANKGNFGHVLVVGGSYGTAGCKAGAPTMAALAALRAGAGLVTAALPAPAVATASATALELMAIPLAVTASGALDPAQLTAGMVSTLLASHTVLAIGPGLGQSDEARQFLTLLLEAAEQPTVLDADALNLLAADSALLARTANRIPLILTPHPGEMARLIGKSTAEVQANRLQSARDFAQRFHLTLVLKGARTLIAHPNGTVAVNTSGNPGMAKAGSGDVLTGLIAGLIAQFPAQLDQATEAAVCLHGLAADLAVELTGERGLMATDGLLQLGTALELANLNLQAEENFATRGQTSYGFLGGLAAHRALVRKNTAPGNLRDRQ